MTCPRRFSGHRRFLRHDNAGSAGGALGTSPYAKQPFLYGSPFGADVRESAAAQVVSDNDHHDQLFGPIGPVPTKSLSHEALGAVAHHSPPHTSRRGHAEPGLRASRVYSEQEHETRRNYLPSGALERAELGALSHPVGCVEPAEARSQLLLGTGRDGQAPATTTTAILQHGAPTAGLQALTKAVCSQPADVVRLIRTFHEN